MSAHKTLLVITDGIGHNPSPYYNAFLAASTPTYDALFQGVPRTLLRTSGSAVGLPEGQMGNSEVGHLTIGSGQVLPQNLVRIAQCIQAGALASNPALTEFFRASQRLHVVGLMSDGGVHSHLDHLLAVIALAERSAKEVYVHVITDGRDVSPRSARRYLAKLLPLIKGSVHLASLGGRFFAMDRDQRWERTEQAYEAIAKGVPSSQCSPDEYIQHSYASETTDEFIVPTAFEGYEGFQPGDGLVCVNFRNDRMRQLTAAFGETSFVAFERPCCLEHLITMTPYDETFAFPVMFPALRAETTLAEVIAQAGLRQLHIAETEKYAHVTFFLNGGKETPYSQEDRVLIPSPRVSTYDLEPRMGAEAIADAAQKGMEASYDFIVLNFANGDMVGHTGNYDAGILAVECVDEQLGRVLAHADALGYAWIVTSDHGNCEAMRDANGEVLTSHTVFDVHCFVKAPGVKTLRTGEGLSSLAASVLKLMALEAPRVMDDALF